jgi:myo-inositol 2-dehydrogenase/D-chiro-inositol 1-dehydrogenase
MNIALIGCGRIGKMHYNKLKFTSGLKVKYIVDDYVKNSEYPNTIIKRISDLDNVLSDPDLEAVIIAASSSAHVELIRTVARHGKHIFCEKPISFNVEILNEVKKEIKKSGIKFQVGLNRRFDPDFTALKKSIDKGTIGSVQIIKITNRDPKKPDLGFASKSGGLFFDFNTHDFDMVHYLTGQKITEVYAIGNALIEPKLKELGDIDTTLISLKLESGALVMIDCSRETNFGYDQRIEVFGSKGMLQVDNISETLMTCTSHETSVESQLPYWSFIERYENAYMQELTSFRDYLNDDIAESPVNIEDMIKSVKVAMAVQSSYESKKCISL